MLAAEPVPEAEGFDVDEPVPEGAEVLEVVELSSALPWKSSGFRVPQLSWMFSVQAF